MSKQEGTGTSPRHMGVTIAGSVGKGEENYFEKNFRAAIVARHSFCPVRDIMDRISDKWSMLAVLALGAHGTLRFNQVKHLIGDVSQRMLTVTLKNLEADGFVTRTIYAEVPPRVEYTLTPLGMGLLQQFNGLADWANANGESIMKSRKRNKKKVEKK
jgi:DNA-binding HxlR family transcriptional regulator